MKIIYDIRMDAYIKYIGERKAPYIYEVTEEFWNKHKEIVDSLDCIPCSITMIEIIEKNGKPYC